MFIKTTDDAVRFTGRWNVTEDSATTTAPGGMIEIAYSGTAAVLHFDLTMNMHPYPHLWVSVDNGAKIEVPVDHVIRVEAPDEGDHVVRVIYKGAVENQHRWYQPLIGKIVFTGVDADAAAVLPEDNRKIIEFIGDSITEGVLIDAFYRYDEYDQFNRPNQDDSTATYAYLTAMNLNMKPVIMGYGATGVTTSGCGSVPPANESYPYVYNGVGAKAQGSEIIVINHGVNDGRNGAEMYIREYEKFLYLVRKINPDSKIVALSPFYGIFQKELCELVERFNKENNDDVKFIDSTGWVPREPLHPLRDGHKIISEHLTEELKKLFW